jgi:RHS repeat-associated protein
MARNTHTISFKGIAFAVLAVAVFQVMGQVHRAEEIPRRGKITDGTHALEAESLPAGFVVLDIQPTVGEGIVLTWSDLGPNFVYTVESCDSLTEQNWSPVSPVEQWPTSATSWNEYAVSGWGCRFYRIHTEALYDPPSAPSDVTAAVEDGEVVITWSPVPGASSYNVYWSTDEKFSPLEANKIENATSPFIHTIPGYGVTYYYVVTAVGNKGESEVSNVVSAMRVPPISPTVATTVFAATEFLYTGDNPIQTGVEPETIGPKRVAVLCGNAMTRDNEPLSGVTITVLNHPEYGQTQSQGNGTFDMAVNGGGYLTVNYEKDGYLAAQRQIDVPWQDYVWLPDVVMIQADPVVTTVDLTAPIPMQVAQGSVVTDEDGTRQATVLFPQGTQAEMVMPDGSTQPISSLSVRATEYTVGDNGANAMPAELPPTSAYTYCVELTADEALAAGATNVRFDKPLHFYVEDFIGFPVGSAVPTGYYDRQRGAWVPSDDGCVIQLLGITGGLATVDTDGDGLADDASRLDAMGITNAEREQLASLYSPGQSLWRVSIAHFTPYDPNWTSTRARDAQPPKQKTPETRDESEKDVPEETECKQEGGSTILFQSQVLGERIPVVGIPCSLNYRSDRTGTGRVDISLSGPSVPESLLRIQLRVEVAGQRHLMTFPPEPNQKYTFIWDGKDKYGRTLTGAQKVTVSIGYVYWSYYYPLWFDFGRTFGGYAGAAMFPELPPIIAREEDIMWQAHTSSVRRWTAPGQSLAGWSLDAHHAYDGSRTLYLGSGGRRSALAIGRIIPTVAGGGKAYPGDGGPATEASIGGLEGIGLGPDGSFYIAASWDDRIRRVGPEGIITTVAGIGGKDHTGYTGDGGPATEAQLFAPHDVAVAADGSFYIADEENYRIRRVGPDGIITTVAGAPEWDPGGYWVGGYSGDGGPATEAMLDGPMGVAVGSDGSIYVADAWNNRIRRVGSDGIITTVAGTGTQGFAGDDGPATEARLSRPYDVAVAADGSLYIADFLNARIRRVAPDGIITTVAGTGEKGYSGDGGPATEAMLNQPEGVAVDGDGSLYIAERHNSRVRRVGPDGIITTIAGTGQTGHTGQGGLATAAQLFWPRDVAIGPDGCLYIADSPLIRRTELGLPPFSGAAFTIPSEDASEFYEFDAQGRHLRTLNALTRATLYEFRYDNEGRLIEIEDGDGNVTTIERDAEGNPTAIVAPFGQRTTLTVNAVGLLATVTNPAGETTSLGYGADGLLTSTTDPKGNTCRFTYDASGHLIRHEDPAGGFTTLSRTKQENGFTVTATTAMGRKTEYQVERLSTGETRLTNTFGCCGQSETVIGTDGTRKTTLPDGTEITTKLGPDPRFGMQSPLAGLFQFRTPSGLVSERRQERSVELSDPTDPLSLLTQTDTISINGRVYTRQYLAENRFITRTSPAGRQRTLTTDSVGRVTRNQKGNLAESSLAYDDRGRLIGVTQGTGTEARTYTYNWGPRNWLSGTTDALGQTKGFEVDEAGRVTVLTLPGGREVRCTYDANGNLLTISPPARPDHRFEYGPRNLLGEYIAPDVGTGSSVTRYDYDLDRLLLQVLLSDGSAVDWTYDENGRPNTVNHAQGHIAYTYDPLTGNPQTVSTSEGETVTYEYDGSLVSKTIWSGAVSGTVTYTYDNEFRLVADQVNGGDGISYAYDADGYLIRAGDLTINRDPDTGMVLESTLGTVTDNRTHNGFGEPTFYEVAVGGTPVYSVRYDRDVLGRIVERQEAIDGIVTTYGYEYDTAGRLSDVYTDGELIGHYEYDPNGNRLSATGPAGTPAGTYDVQDRLLAYGDASYTYTAAGQLQSRSDGRGTTNFEYDGLANLRSVTLPDGTTIQYVMDGRGCRVAKMVNGDLVQELLYRDPLNVIAELDGQGSLVSRFVYASRGHVPDYMIKGGRTFRLISGHLGSPRLLVDVGTGEIAQRINYDEWGRVILDSNPGFQPFGFAGGLYDPDTALTTFGARDYDCDVGRWTAKDPLLFQGRDVNLYAYVLNDPIQLIDPTGLSVTCEMMQSTGEMVCTDDATGETLEDQGYSGNVLYGGLNNPGMECVESVGPIQRGDYLIGIALPQNLTTTGPVSLPLTPITADQCRPGPYRVHGAPTDFFRRQRREGSSGCPIFGPDTRNWMNDRGGGILHVR